MDKKSEATRVLIEAGIVNPGRVVKLIRETIAKLELDLTGLSVLTEAASGPFVVTPIIAALSGAREVIAVTQDSVYATTNQVIRQTRALEALCGIEGKVEIHRERRMELFSRPDIITNLGFVRPLDHQTIGHMRHGAVIALMCEAWEIRENDIDLDACNEYGISVYGTNEDFPTLDVFAYSGWVALQLLLEAGIELHKSRISVIGSDKFARTITSLLTRAGVCAKAYPRLDLNAIHEVDVILVADYSRHDFIVGLDGDLSAETLSSINPTVTIVQFAGMLDLEGLQRNSIAVYPGKNLQSHRMMRTLAALGPRPVVELHAGGMKAASLAVVENQVNQIEPWADLCQKII